MVQIYREHLRLERKDRELLLLYEHLKRAVLPSGHSHLFTLTLSLGMLGGLHTFTTHLRHPYYQYSTAIDNEGWGPNHSHQVLLFSRSDDFL